MSRIPGRCDLCAAPLAAGAACPCEGKPRIGLYDTIDQCWLGDAAGPRLFTDQGLAQMAAQVWAVQMDWPETRVRPQPFAGAGAIKDRMPRKRTGREAMRRILRGG